MSGPAVWIEIGDRPNRVVVPPELPKRGAIVRVEKVAEVAIAKNHTSSAYRLTDVDGRPLLMGLSTSVSAAEELAKSRGWRPEVASIVTNPRPKVAKTRPKIYQGGLELEE